MYNKLRKLHCRVCIWKLSEGDFNSHEEAVLSVCQSTQWFHFSWRSCAVCVKQHTRWFHFSEGSCGVHCQSTQRVISLLMRKLCCLCVKAHKGWFHFSWGSCAVCVSKHTEGDFTSHEAVLSVCQSTQRVISLLRRKLWSLLSKHTENDITWQGGTYGVCMSKQFHFWGGSCGGCVWKLTRGAFISG